MERLAAVVFAVGLVAGGGVAVAKSPHTGRPARASAGILRPVVQQPAHTSGVPKRYELVWSGALGAPNGIQTHGAVTCPPRTVPWGGGVWIESGGLGANLNSSYPISHGWAGDMNNAGGADATFRVYAICAKRPRAGYSIRSATVTNIAGHQTSAVVRCPGTAELLGGGGFSSSKSTAVNINSTFPLTTKTWQLNMNNASESDAGATVYAVCSKGRRREILVGAPVANPAGQQTQSTIFCPNPHLPAGGGERSSSASTAVSLNSTIPVNDGSGWYSWENNASGLNETTTSYVICIGT